VNDIMKATAADTLSVWVGTVPLVLFFAIFVAISAWTLLGPRREAPPLE
jgi:hypothetical protein